MPGQPDAREIVARRDQYTRRRVAAFFQQIDDLEYSDFPHDDARIALRQLRRNLSARIGRVQTSSESDESAETTHLSLDLVLTEYTKLLGIILRSTNVRNPFEIYQPLRRLIQALLPSSTKLLISAEWDYVPFAYPLNLAALPDFVVIGLPAAEANNVLLAPLAGHEIGHALWIANRVNMSLDLPASELIAAIFQDGSDFRAIWDDELDGRDFDADRDVLQSTVLLKAQEVFCDLIGIGCFGSSFACAAEYLICPGSPERSDEYPADALRFELMRRFLERLHLTPIDEVFSLWPECLPPETIEDAFGQAEDEIVDRLFPLIADEALRILNAGKVQPPSQRRVRKIVRCLRKGVPYDGEASLSEIVEAGWSASLHWSKAEGGDADRRTLMELVLKTVEVSEFRLRIRDAEFD